jgi:hypothetical protein
MPIAALKCTQPKVQPVRPCVLNLRLSLKAKSRMAMSENRY